ncbi:NUDIX hydrolase domain-like protein [Amanita muscaria]
MNFFERMFRTRQSAPTPTSTYSTPLVPDSGWASLNFLLGAGMVIIQPSTNKIVIVHEPSRMSWFLPRGRKDVGESLEQAALREAYEESGYRVEFLPLYTQSRAPPPPSNPEAGDHPNTEPIYVTLTSYGPAVRRHFRRPAGEYLTSWYVGQIPENAVRESGTGMPDEQDYQSYIVSVEDALKLLDPTEATVLCYAWALYQFTYHRQEPEHSTPVQGQA